MLALACVVSGCSSSDDGAKSDAGIAFEELPDELVKSTCQLLERCGGVKEVAWRELGLRNRYQLHRLLKKLRID